MPSLFNMTADSVFEANVEWDHPRASHDLSPLGSQIYISND